MGYKRKKVCGLDPEFGAIFMSNTRTKEECIDKQLFGLPSIHCEFVRKVKVGMILFLFEYENRKLHGVFEAVSDGEVNIVPSAYRYTTGKSFPAQVRVRRIAHCLPLSEHEFSAVIKDNYYSLKKFNFGLSKHQVQELLFLFKLRKVEESSKDSREKNVMTQGVMSSQRKMQRHPSDDDTATKVKLGSLMMEYSAKIIVPPQEVVSQLGGECQLSCCFPRSSKNQLWTSSQSHQIQDEYYTTDGCKCCECETLLMDDGCPPDDDFGDFIPLPNSSDEEDNYHPAEEKEEVDARDQTGYAKNCVFYGGRNEYLSNVLSTRSMPSFGGETNQLIGTTSQMFTDKEKSWIVGESVNFATARSNNNRLVSSNTPATICPDDSNMTCATASSKNVLLGNNVKGGLYCGTPKPRRISVFSRLNWRTTPQDQEIRARADQYVDEITQELQNKYDFGEEMLQQMKRQKFTASEIVDKEEQITLHPNPDPSKGGSSVFQRLGKRVGGSRLETLLQLEKAVYATK